MSNQQVKQHSKTAAKKRDILKKALGCFSTHGVAGTTIEMICQETGTSVGSLYHHFGNKEAIASAVYIEGLNDFGSLAVRYLTELEAKQLSLEEKAEQAIKVMVYANVDWISENQDWARFIFQHRQVVREGKGAGVLKDNLSTFYKKLIDYKRPMVDAGLLKDWPIEMFSAFISGPVHDYARHYLAGRYSDLLSDYREELAEGAWRALKG
ncbi:TetR/AcrR family transcriptional regulator [Litoribrevibacter euphylliae]|uniref:TetR/AcrR family transcriptional regulator n=1 Tax=Litoribrevibacter euphylliae TaxID=1834034 RepID=A0ABV7HIS2_9GAMM